MKIGLRDGTIDPDATMIETVTVMIDTETTITSTISHTIEMVDMVCRMLMLATITHADMDKGALHVDQDDSTATT